MPTELALLTEIDVRSDICVQVAEERDPEFSSIEYRDGEVRQFLNGQFEPILTVFRSRPVLDVAEAATCIEDPPRSFSLWTEAIIPFGADAEGRELLEAIAQRHNGSVRARI